LDILPASVFEEWKKLKANPQRQYNGGEIQLRTAMKEGLMTQGKLFTSLLPGVRFDIGTPAAYWESLQRLYHSDFESDNLIN
jgi:UTP-glucose-1-phosphate uridylyltransferase